MQIETHEIVQDRRQFRTLLHELEAADTIAFDLETTGFEADGYGAKPATIVGWAFSTAPRLAWYVPVGHHQGQQLAPEEVAKALKPIFEDPSKTWIIHNAKFDTHFLTALGINIDYDHVEDTMLEASVAGYKDQLQRVGLKYIEAKVWKYDAVSFEELFGTTKERNIATVPIDMAGPYACDDADYCLRIHLRYYDFIQRHKQLKEIYDLERKLWPLTQKIEDTGIYTDEEFANAAMAYLRSEAAKVYQIIVDQIMSVSVFNRLQDGEDVIWEPTKYKKPIKKKGEPYPYWLIGFNPASDAQLRDVLFNVLGLTPVKTTKGGNASTGKLTLDRLGKDLPVCKNISTYKQMLDAVSKLRKEILGSLRPDGRAHTNYNQTGTRSGRYSSSSPNFQNLAREKKWTINNIDGSTYEVKLSLRDAFKAAPGYYLLEFDFSAIEFAIYAKFAHDDSVVQAYEQGLDVHKQMASELYGIPEPQVTKDQRDLAKQINYLTIYEGTGMALSMRTELDRFEADHLIKKFFQIRPKFKRFAELVHSDVRDTHVVFTLFGRPIYIGELDSDNMRDRMKGFRAAVNGIIQGTAADVHKKGLLRAQERVSALYGSDQARMLLQTHDSQTWEVRLDIPPEVFIPIVIAAMPTNDSRLPKIRVDAKVGIAWGSTVELSDDKSFNDLVTDLGVKYQQKIDIMVANTDPEPETIQISEPKKRGPAKKKGESLLLEINCQFNDWIARDLVEILEPRKGHNVVVLVYEDGVRESLTSHPTSLGPGELKRLVHSFLPEAKVKLDRDSMMEEISEVFAL